MRHEVAEEHVIYPIIRRATPEGEEEARTRIAEQSKAEGLLAEMEKLDVSSSDFTTTFIILRQSVLAHAASEESSTFPILEQSEDAETLGPWEDDTNKPRRRPQHTLIRTLQTPLRAT